ncbi:hypothetical protein BHOIPH791_09420 [Bartonella henselae]|uniref:Hypothetical membrane protein n=2 Tax=Bartonellaceae TaxID=772 RepID=X5M0L8_BARHN|nr:hypothetical protein [Bartonella henselae]ETS05894.1 hypothetical protein Q654_01441 [Bartonella henselae JK 50]ETS10930.1 hypothetical protein Q653_00464 [Bartonella henselae JK 42]ETS13787.1 hypothetical protein Q652_00597 [Bartonella henselae JK 41]KEC60444.1 hypothetical protein O95_00390 [Bartonella henselae JK 53]ETS06065.1 hypothetical protein Q655_01389 [Bartonella henselae JK 51]
MNIRYIFIAGAITSSLALAMQENDYIINTQQANIINPYTIPGSDLQFIELINIELNK